MKKFLSIMAVLGMAAVIGTQTADAFSWSNLNPFNWGRCSKCETPKRDCGCPVTTGAAAPCDPCAKKAPCTPCTPPVHKNQPCDACDRLQQEMAK